MSQQFRFAVSEPFGRNIGTANYVSKRIAREADLATVVTWRDEFGSSYVMGITMAENDDRSLEEIFFDHNRKFGIPLPETKKDCELWISFPKGEFGEFEVEWHEFTYWPE